MSFVVKKIPLGGEVVGGWSSPIVGVGKGFRTGTKERKTLPQVDATLPNNASNVLAGGDI